jgi:hypothetical membrane protein
MKPFSDHRFFSGIIRVWSEIINRITMRMELTVLVTASALLLIVMFVLPLIGMPEYSVIQNTLSDLGAQSAPYAWVTNFIFILLAAGAVIAGWRYYDGHLFHRIILLIFGLSLTLAALLNDAPVGKTAHYNTGEAGWHAYFESTSLLAFIILSLSTTLMRERQGGRILSVASGILVIFLSVLMSETDHLAGVFQRLIFIIMSGWLIYTFGIRE